MVVWWLWFTTPKFNQNLIKGAVMIRSILRYFFAWLITCVSIARIFAIDLWASAHMVANSRACKCRGHCVTKNAITKCIERKESNRYRPLE
ncbi:hypothetical protein EDD21DRAFT_365668 [Dissophora ornata]|nr:hypothetical protein EDD21DRAFT_365668 [Dissophora ornata]